VPALDEFCEFVEADGLAVTALNRMLSPSLQATADEVIQ
jgi:hypothetical protein